ELANLILVGRTPPIKMNSMARSMRCAFMIERFRRLKRSSYIIWVNSMGKIFNYNRINSTYFVFLIVALFYIFNPILSPNVLQAATLSRPANNLGLISYFPMNEGVGTHVGDFSGTGGSGTLMNGVTFVNGRNGKAVRLDGSNDYVITNKHSNVGTD